MIKVGYWRINTTNVSSSIAVSRAKSLVFDSTLDSLIMAESIARQVLLELADMSQPDLGKPSALSSQPVGLEGEQVPLNDDKKAKKPLSFYMTFLALNICVLLVSLDATALSVAVPVSST